MTAGTAGTGTVLVIPRLRDIEYVHRKDQQRGVRSSTLVLLIRAEKLDLLRILASVMTGNRPGRS